METWRGLSWPVLLGDYGGAGIAVELTQNDQIGFIQPNWIHSGGPGDLVSIVN